MANDKYILSDVPDAEVEAVASDFQSEGLTTSRTQQPDGKWTVEAKDKTAESRQAVKVKRHK